MRKHHRNGNLRFLHASPLDVAHAGHPDQDAAARHDLAHHVAPQTSASADDELTVLLLPMGFPSEEAVAALRPSGRAPESPEVHVQSVIFAVDPETVEDTLWDVSPAVEVDSRPELPTVHATQKGEPHFIPEREYCRTTGEFLAAEVAYSSSLLAVNNLDAALAPHHPDRWERGIELIGEIAPHLTIVDATATPRRSSSTHAGMFASFDEHAAKQRRSPGSIPEYDGAAASTVVLRTSQPVDPRCSIAPGHDGRRRLPRAGNGAFPRGSVPHRGHRGGGAARVVRTQGAGTHDARLHRVRVEREHCGERPAGPIRATRLAVTRWAVWLRDCGHRVVPGRRATARTTSGRHGWPTERAVPGQPLSRQPATHHKGDTMKVRNSLRALKKIPGSQIVRRRGRTYVINKKNPRMKARQAEPRPCLRPADDHSGGHRQSRLRRETRRESGRHRPRP